MSVTSVGSGSQVIAALNTEYTLDTETDVGVYVLVVDTNVLANGDVLVIRLYTKTKSGSTSRLAYEATFANVQGEPNKYSPAIPIDTELVCKIEQTNGTTRTFDWNLLKM
jgi:hypothetical protein